MRNTPMFESDSHGSTSSSRETAGDHHGFDEWGIVSVSSESGEVGVVVQEEEEEEENESFSTESGADMMNTGILIVDGVDSSLGDPSYFVGSGSWDLSIPRTDSFPTEIGTLEDHRSQSQRDEGDHTPLHVKSWSRHQSYVLLLFGLVLVSTGAGLWTLSRERNTWRLSALQLELEVARLAQEAEQMRVNLEASSVENKEEASPNSVTLLDNCWVQAKADFKLGMCGKETRDSFRETLGAIWKAASVGGDWSSPLEDHSEESHDDSSKTEQQSSYDNAQSFNVLPLPLAVGEAFAAASERIASKITELLGDSSSKEEGGEYDSFLDEAAAGLSVASVALGEAIAAAGEAISLELKELADDPWTYMADSAREAMQDASYYATSRTRGDVRTKAFVDAVSVVSSSSLAWGEAMAKAGEAVTEAGEVVLEDPLNFATGKLCKNKN
jgi:hypothetical protein